VIFCARRRISTLVPPVMTSAADSHSVEYYQLDPELAGRKRGMNSRNPGARVIRPSYSMAESPITGLPDNSKKTMSLATSQMSYTFGKCRDTSSAPVTGRYLR